MEEERKIMVFITQAMEKYLTNESWFGGWRRVSPFEMKARRHSL
jgi:hypothetical protein